MKIDFEDYLMEKHSEQYIGLDDDMPDDFNDWLCQLDPQEIIDFAEEALKLERIRILEKVEKLKGVKQIVDTNPNYPEFDIKQMKSCFMIDREEVKQIIKG